MQEKLKYYLIRTLCICVALQLPFSLIACGGEAASEPETQNHEEIRTGEIELAADVIRETGVRIEQAKTIELKQVLEATGTVSSDESRLVHLRPLARGVIEEVHVRRGDRVREGQPLIQYDNIELGELIGQYIDQHLKIHSADTDVEVAKKLWERGVELLEVQAIARKEVELREAQFRKAEAAVESHSAVLENIEEKLHRFGISDQDIEELNAQHSGGHRTASLSLLKAPFSGVIIGYDVAKGEVVDPSRELLTLADLSSVWVLADIYEKDLGLVKEGQPVEVVTSSYPGQIFRGTLTYISDVLERETRTAKLRCVVPNAENFLKLEMFVTVRIPTTEKQTAVAVPEAAIQTIEGQDVVFVAEETGHFRQLEIRRGLAAEGWVAIEGLEEGASVVTTGSFYLKSALKRSEIGDGHGH